MAVAKELKQDDKITVLEAICNAPMPIRESLFKAIDSPVQLKKTFKDYEEFMKSEGSRGGKIVGHTKSGKPVYEASHETYTALGKLPKYNGKVSVHTAHGSDSGKLLRQRTDFDKQDHLDAAEHHSREANKLDNEHTIAKHEAEKKAYGKVRGLAEGYYKTSGGVDENYTPEENDRIRELAHGATRHRSAAMAHEYAAKGYRKKSLDGYGDFVKSHGPWKNHVSHVVVPHQHLSQFSKTNPVSNSDVDRANFNKKEHGEVAHVFKIEEDKKGKVLSANHISSHPTVDSANNAVIKRQAENELHKSLDVDFVKSHGPWKKGKKSGYTGDHEKDFADTAIMPHAIAEGVASNVMNHFKDKKWTGDNGREADVHKHLMNKFADTYKNNPKWGKTIRHNDNEKGRDTLTSFMHHWAAGKLHENNNITGPEAMDYQRKHGAIKN